MVVMSRLSTHVRVRGIEPRSNAWEALVLPLNYTRRTLRIYHSVNEVVDEVVDEMRQKLGTIV